MKRATSSIQSSEIAPSGTNLTQESAANGCTASYGDDSLRRLADQIERDISQPVHVGRPPGVGRHVQADDRAMRMIADMLIVGAVESATSAMRQLYETGAVTGQSREAVVRRLQRRWQQRATTELAAARDAQRQKLRQNVGTLSRFPLLLDAPILNPPEVANAEHDHEDDGRQAHENNSEPAIQRRVSGRS